MPKIISTITGTGSSVPIKKLTNKDLEKIIDTTDEWITTRTGIKQRYVATGDETTASLAVEASVKAIENSGVAPVDIDLIVVGTVTPDKLFPSTACFVQKDLTKIGVGSTVPSFDVSAACSGFLYALDIADKYIKSGDYKNVLIIGSETFSRIVDWKDRTTCILFGDGAGAAVLSASDSEQSGGSGLLCSNINADGSMWDMLYATGEDPKNGLDDENKEPELKESPYVQMKGNETFKVAVRTMEEAARQALSRAGLTSSDISLVIPHQANSRIISAIASRLELEDNQVFSNIADYGNTSAASIPIALDEANRSGRIKKGDIVLFLSFGGGLTWAASILKW